MVKKISLIIGILISVYVIYQSNFYRKFGYETIPQPITDEFTYIWQAISLEKNGLPMAWTINDGAYLNPKFKPIRGDVKGFGIENNGKNIDLKNFLNNPRPLSGVKEIDYSKGIEQMLFVAPFFDHPPLGGIIFSAGMKDKIKEVEDVKPGDFRKSAIILSIINSGLIFCLVYLLSKNPWIATLSVIIYSTVPTYILASRTAFLENAVVPFALGHLIFLFLSIQIIKNKQKIFFQ